MICTIMNRDFFRIINKYTDLRSLCDTCVLLSTFKKYINYKLNNVHSLMYYDDVLFRNKVLSKIFNPNKQLHLNLNWCTNITDVSALSDVHTLNLRGCKNITDVSALSGVHTLDLSICSNITDVSALSGVHTLNLSDCKNITDVSALSGVHTLNLSYTNITDVSALSGVHTLYLSDCPNNRCSYFRFKRLY